jgi:NAD(P)-dependent dehydrogenase (short-subunit alcohol dehydrogenase family)
VTDQPVVVVTGGGGGIGAAVAEELGRDGWYVVTLDPLVSLDGSEQLPPAEETTAGRIAAAGGTARASSASVTDAEAVRGLFEGLVDELGRLDAVINVAGISRPTSFTSGTDHDWRSILSVHLDGYLNVLRAALPIMAAAGHGRILGVTSGSGWRQADTGAYGCAKRAVAALTWELGRRAPEGVVVNAMSPIAVTRMVTAALSRTGGGARGATASGPAGAAASSATNTETGAGRRGSGSAATGGLSLGSMPTPEQLGPLGAHLVGEGFSWCTGQVIFAGGSEVAVIDRPRLLEVVRTDEAPSVAQVLEEFTAGALAPAEASQASGGGSNPRFSTLFDESHGVEIQSAAVGSCAIVTNRPELAAVVSAALEPRSVSCSVVDVGDEAGGFREGGFEAASAALEAAATQAGPIDAIVVALAGAEPATGSASDWERVLQEHAGIVAQIHDDAGWARAAADYSASNDRPVRLVTLTDAIAAGGRSRAQASAQLARSARRATGDRVAAFAVSVEAAPAGDGGALSELVAHLICSPDAVSLSGAELVVDAGWVGLRSHPRPGASITFGGPEIPDWLDDALRSIVGAPDRPGDVGSRPPAPGAPE